MRHTILVLALMGGGLCASAALAQGLRLRTETLALSGEAELVTIFADSSASENSAEDSAFPLLSVVRDRLGRAGPSSSRLRQVWVFTYARPTVPQRMAAAFPFLFRRTLRNTGSAHTPPKPLMDLSAPERAPFANVLGMTMQAGVFDLNGALLRTSSRTYQGNSREYERIHAEQALEALAKLDSESTPESAGVASGLQASELEELQARLALNKRMFGGWVRNSRLSEVYEKNRLDTGIDRARNWELLRQRAEQAGLYFEPLAFGQPVPGQALLWISEEDLRTDAGRKFDPALLSIRDPWNDACLKRWKGYRETWYFDFEGRRLTDATGAAKSTQMIPLALYSLDYRTVPLLLVDFRSEWKPKRRELLRRTADTVATGVLGLTGPFSNLEYFVAKSSFQWIRGRHGDAVDRNARLDAYAGVRFALLLDRAMNPAWKKEIVSRLDQLALNPFEQDLRAETELARRQYAALVQYAQAPDGLAKAVERDRGHELVAYQHGRTSRALLRLATVSTLGIYRHREDVTDESLARLEQERRLQARMQFLEGVLASSPQIDVMWDMAEIRRSLDEIAELEAGGNDARVSRLVSQVFSRTNDEETRLDCLKCLYRLNSPGARQELSRLSKDESVSLELRLACNSYLAGIPPLDPVAVPDEVAGGSGR